MQLKIISFSGEYFFSHKVISITLMSENGEITILDGHSNLLTSVKSSTMYLIYLDDNNIEKREDFAIGKGIVEVSDSGVKIMVDMLVDIDNLDINTVQRARKEATDLMEKFKDPKNKIDMEKFIEAQDLLQKSIAQLKLYDLKKF